MNHTKQLTLGGILVGVTVLFQIAPAVLSEVFVPITLFSTAAMYLLSRLHPRTGIAAYLAAAAVILLISLHEGLFFLCTTGLAGISLGAGVYYTKKRLPAALVAGALLTLTLSLLASVLGIPVVGISLPGGFAARTGILFGISFVYGFIAVLLLEPFYQHLAKKLL